MQLLCFIFKSKLHIHQSLQTWAEKEKSRDDRYDRRAQCVIFVRLLGPATMTFLDLSSVKQTWPDSIWWVSSFGWSELCGHIHNSSHRKALYIWEGTQLIRQPAPWASTSHWQGGTTPFQQEETWGGEAICWDWLWVIGKPQQEMQALISSEQQHKWRQRWYKWWACTQCWPLRYSLAHTCSWTQRGRILWLMVSRSPRCTDYEEKNLCF